MRTPNEPRKIWPHIAFIFFVTSFLDSATTYVGIRWFGGRELNPHIDTSSLGAFLLRGSIIFTAVCILSILSERYISQEVPRMAKTSSFAEFSKKINKTWRAIPWFVLLVIYMLGLVRIAVVLSNSALIVFGFSPGDLASQLLSTILGITQEAAISLLYIAMMLIIVNPAHKSLYRRIRGGGEIVAAER